MKHVHIVLHSLFRHAAGSRWLETAHSTRSLDGKSPSALHIQSHAQLTHATCTGAHRVAERSLGPAMLGFHPLLGEPLSRNLLLALEETFSNKSHPTDELTLSGMQYPHTHTCTPTETHLYMHACALYRSSDADDLMLRLSTNPTNRLEERKLQGFPLLSTCMIIITQFLAYPGFSRSLHFTEPSQAHAQRIPAYHLSSLQIFTYKFVCV